MKILSTGTLAIVVLLALAQIAFLFLRLPVQVATHFDSQGQPNGFMSRQNFAIFMVVMQLSMPAFLMGCGWLTAHLPVSMINVPNREYWLAEPRRPATVATIQLLMVWIAIVTEILLMVLFQLTYHANQNQTGLSPVLMWSTVVVYLVAIFGLCFGIGRRFWTMPSE